MEVENVFTLILDLFESKHNDFASEIFQSICHRLSSSSEEPLKSFFQSSPDSCLERLLLINESILANKIIKDPSELYKLISEMSINRSNQSNIYGDSVFSRANDVEANLAELTSLKGDISRIFQIEGLPFCLEEPLVSMIGLSQKEMISEVIHILKSSLYAVIKLTNTTEPLYTIIPPGQKKSYKGMLNINNFNQSVLVSKSRQNDTLEKRYEEIAFKEDEVYKVGNTRFFLKKKSQRCIGIALVNMNDEERPINIEKGGVRFFGAQGNGGKGWFDIRDPLVAESSFSIRVEGDQAFLKEEGLGLGIWGIIDGVFTLSSQEVVRIGDTVIELNLE